jgi:hypothetical protein
MLYYFRLNDILYPFLCEAEPCVLRPAPVTAQMSVTFNHLSHTVYVSAKRGEIFLSVNFDSSADHRDTFPINVK